MGFRPLHDRIVVEPLAAEEKTVGGIIVPGTALEKPSEGKVVAVGPGYRSKDGKVGALDVKKGDRVLFGKWSGTEIVAGGQNLLVMRESDVLAVIEGNAPVRTRTRAAAPAVTAPADHYHVPGTGCCDD